MPICHDRFGSHVEELANFENMGVEAGKIDSFEASLIVITEQASNGMSEFYKYETRDRIIKSWMKMQTELCHCQSNSKQILADKTTLCSTGTAWINC